MRSLCSTKKVFFFTLAAFFILPQLVAADTLSISPANGSYEMGQTFPVRVLVSSAQPINAVSGSVIFPKDKLQVISVSKTGSVLSLWVQDPTFSNVSGTVNFEGVVPNPGYSGSGGIVVVINFKVVGKGEGLVKFGSSSVLANDGNGTNILKNLKTGTFTLGEYVPTKTESPVTPAPSTKGLPIITSITHINSQEWYAESNAKFSWELPEGTLATKLSLSKQSNSSPTVLYQPAIATKELKDVEDGIWYFNVQLKNKDGWGPIAHRQFRVDTLAPEGFSIAKVKNDDPTDPQPEFFFSVTDAMSGVSSFSIQLDDKKPEIWKSSGNSTYEVPVLGPGTHTLVAKAYDGAGNTALATTDFDIKGLQTPKITNYTEEISVNDVMVVNGIALPDMTVRIALSRKGSVPIIKNVESDFEGRFTAVIEGKDIPKGVYELTATVVDHRGAESEPTPVETVLVKTSWIESVARNIVKYLAILVPLIATLFFLIYVGLRGFHKVRSTGLDLKKEVPIMDKQSYISSVLLNEDIYQSVNLLEKAKTQRPLTKEEDEIIKRLRNHIKVY